MINSEVARRGYSPTYSSLSYRVPDPGHLEDDSFYINDVVLRIPPEDIRVEKRAFNHEWQTIRTQNSQKAKSGHGLVRIAFDAVFKVSNYIDQDNLIRLVAGLRATPFCVVHNKYLDKTVGRPETGGPVVAAKNQTIQFNPIMLALASMTFVTMGHEGKPDCIRGSFDFLWFNYLPLTPIIAFKTGPTNSSPGHAVKSEIWRKFYEPFLNVCKPVSFPHEVDEDLARTTEFMWREYLAVPRGSPIATAAAKDLADVLEKHPKAILQELTAVTEEAKNNPSILTEGVLDILYRRLIQKSGLLNPNDEMRQQIELFLKNGAITEAGGDILSPVIRNLQGKDNLSAGDMNQIKAAAATMAGRLKKMRQIKERGDVAIEGAIAGGYTNLIDADSTFDAAGTHSASGGLQLYGRKRYYKIRNSSRVDPDDPYTAVIQQIVISFENILATIPMIGYRYPLLQHIGSIDARVHFVINAKNEAAGQISQMYDSNEKMALQYKQIPQGFNNLYIKNDFLSLFGLSEFMTEQLNIETIREQPSRSMVSMSLVQAGVTSSLKIDNPEELKQEYILGSEDLYKKIYEVIKKKLMRMEGGGVDGNEHLRPTQTRYHYVKTTGIKRDGSQALLADIVDEARDAYNGFVKDVHGEIFGGWKPKQTLEKTVKYAALKYLATKGEKEYGYTAGVKQILIDVNTRWTAYKTDISTAKAIEESKKIDKLSDKYVQEQVAARKKLETEKKIEKWTGSIESREAAEEAKAEQEALVKDLGVNRYQQRMRKIFNKVRSKYLDLPEFKHLKKIVENSGLGVGRMAYPDFKPQIASVAGWAENVTTVNEAQLMKYEPDCYFWYPLFNGGNLSPLTGIVDDYYLNEAQKHSLKVWRNAQEDVGKFFKNTYQKELNNPANKGPYNALTKELAPELYKNDKLGNSLTYTDTSISKKTVCDAQSKTPSNWYPKGSTALTSGSGSLPHSTDLEVLFGGVSSSPSGEDPSGAAVASDVGKITPRTSGQLVGKNKWEKLDQLREEVQPIFEQLLDELKDTHGYHPRIVWGYRSAEQQADKKKKGLSLSKSPSYHQYGLALDIIDRRWGWKPSLQNATFLGKMARIAQQLGLTSGAMWFKEGVGEAWRPYGLGWDPAHVQFPSNRTPREWKQDVMESRLSTSAQRRKISPILQQQIDKNRTQSVGRSVTATTVSPIKEAIKEFESDLYNGQAQSMMRAYPTFKLYFIEDDSTEGKRLAFDDFFSYSAVQSIRVIRSRKIAADLCEIYLTNISGVLSNRKFRQRKGNTKPFNKDGKMVHENPNAIKADTAQENPIASLLLQEGMDIHLRLGYSSSPDRLPTVFNGTITEVEFSDSDDLVRVIAQSHAIELVQDIKGIEKPQKKESSSAFGWQYWGFGEQATTGRVLEEMMAEPEVLHFGRWTPTAGGETPSRGLLTQRWTFYPQPADDNIFAPPPKDDLGKLADGKFLKNLKYIIYRTTIWDIFQEMTLRHPNYIALPVPYQDQGQQRMTMFFGLPNQLYFARHLSPEESLKDEKLKQILNKAIQTVKEDRDKGQMERKMQMARDARRIKAGGASLTKEAEDNLIADALRNRVNLQRDEKLIESVYSNFQREFRLNEAKKGGFIRPFRNYHLITSANHIVANNIRASSRDVANTIVIKYGKDIRFKDDDGNTVAPAIKGDEQTFILKLDSALPTEDIHTQVGQFINVTNEELAKRYALGLLCRNLKDIYKGELIILGNPKIKPCDITYLFDEYTDMIGAFEVEEVQHVFDQQHGFRTGIKPDMLVQAAEWSLLGSAEALGVVMEGVLRNVFGSTASSLLGWTIGHGLAAVGGFLANKIINYTQLAHPVVMSPLMHHGRIFTGGVPTRKLPVSTWNTIFGDWSARWDVGYHDWVEDTKEEMLGWIMKNTGSYTRGDFFNNGGSNIE